jgi:hypothetical protein
MYTVSFCVSVTMVIQPVAVYSDAALSHAGACKLMLIMCSDSASALAILRETIAREATQRRIHITDSYQVSSDCATMPYYAQ